MTGTDPNLTIVDHPLVGHRLRELRDPATQPERFRHLLRDVSTVIACEAARDLPVHAGPVRTVLGEAPGVELAVTPVVVPVLRAGLGMDDAVRDILPGAREGFIGIYRHPGTHAPVQYYAKLPPAENSRFFIVDPMLATGQTAVAAMDLISTHGVAASEVRMLALIAAPEGLQRVRESYPDIPIYVAAVDEKLNDHDYIVPGIGDAGDRLFGTE